MIETFLEWWHRRRTIRNFRAATARAIGVEYAEDMPLCYKLFGHWGSGFYIDNGCMSWAQVLIDGEAYLDELIERAKESALQTTEPWKYRGLWVGQEAGQMGWIVGLINEKHAPTILLQGNCGDTIDSSYNPCVPTVARRSAEERKEMESLRRKTNGPCREVPGV